MSYQHAVPVDHKSVTFSVKRKLAHHRLYSLKLDIKRDDALSVRQHSADRYYKITCLYIDIGHRKYNISIGSHCLCEPIAALRVIIFRRDPVKTVYVFTHDIAVNTGIILVKLLGDIFGFIYKEFMYPRRGGTAYQHVVYAVAGNVKYVLRSVYMIVDHCGYRQYPVFHDSIRIGYGYVIHKLCCIDHHDRHEYEQKDHRYDHSRLFM